MGSRHWTVLTWVAVKALPSAAARTFCVGEADLVSGFGREADGLAGDMALGIIDFPGSREWGFCHSCGHCTREGGSKAKPKTAKFHLASLLM